VKAALPLWNRNKSRWLPYGLETRKAAASKTVMLSCRLNRCIDPTDTTVVPDLLLLGLQAGEAVCQIEVEIEIRLD